MVNTVTYQQWIEQAVTHGLGSPAHLPTGRVWLTSGSTVHADTACMGSKSVRFWSRDNSQTIVDCTRCLRALRDSDDPEQQYRWAVYQTLALFSAEGRGYRNVPGAPSFSTALGAWRTDRCVQELRKVPPASPAAPLVCRLADTIEAQTLRPEEFSEHYQRVILATATLWGRIRTIGSRRLRIHRLGVTYPGQAATDRRFVSVEKYLDGDVQRIYENLIGGYADGEDWAGQVDAIDWRPGNVQAVEDQYLFNIDDIPEVFRFRREDFETSRKWLEAEYRQALREQTHDLLALMKAELAEFTPDHVRMWVTVTVPKRFPNRDGSVLAYVAWFQQAMVKDKLLAQVPFTVLAMLCRLTNSQLSDWRPMASDPVSQATLDATLALLQNDFGLHILDAYATACAVTGIEETDVFGAPGLTVTPPVLRTSAAKKREAAYAEPLFGAA